MMPVNDMIGPWLTVALMNFNMPLGLVLQGGANKAILDGQREDNRIAFSAYRRYFAEQIENKLIPRITATASLCGTRPHSPHETRPAE